jgi:rhodanese-related sulfurtransferase
MSRTGRRLSALLVAVLLAPGLVACGSGGSKGTAGVVKVAPAQASDLARQHSGDATFVTLDVRTPEEFAGGHLAGATNVDVNASDFGARVGRLARTSTYLVYCHSGNRSARATAQMHDLGFGHVYELTGGIAAWEQAGQPVVR